MGVEILVVQHGEKVPSAGDPGLAEEGHRQATAVARWLAANRVDIDAIVSSPFRRAQETAAPIAAEFGLVVTTEPRVGERMNWDDDASISFDEFLAEWRRATDDRNYHPAVGDSSNTAAARFIDALVDLEHDHVGVVVVSHGGVTVDALRTIAGDASVREANADLVAQGVPSCAITRFRVCGGAVAVIDYPSTDHLDRAARDGLA